mgnify:CR=1 FL=1
MEEHIFTTDFDSPYEIHNHKQSYEEQFEEYDRKYTKKDSIDITDNRKYTKKDSIDIIDDRKYTKKDNMDITKDRKHSKKYELNDELNDEQYGKKNKYDDSDIYYTKYDDSFYNNNLDYESYAIYQKTKLRILELSDALQNDFDEFDLADRNDYMGQLDDNKELMKIFYKLALKNIGNQDIKDRLDINKYKQTLAKECEIQIWQEKEELKKKSAAFQLKYIKETKSIYEKLKSQHEEYHSQVENLRDLADIFRNYIDEIKKYTYSMTIEQMSRRIRYIESTEKLMQENQKELDKLKIALKNRKPDSSSQRLTDNLQILTSFDKFHEKYLSFTDPLYVCNKNKMKFATIDDFDNLIDTHCTEEIKEIIDIDTSNITAKSLLDFKKYNTDAKQNRRFKYLKEKEKKGTIIEAEVLEYEQWVIYINSKK